MNFGENTRGESFQFLKGPKSDPKFYVMYPVKIHKNDIKLKFKHMNYKFKNLLRLNAFHIIGNKNLLKFGEKKTNQYFIKNSKKNHL